MPTITNLLADAAAGALPAPVVSAGPDGDEVFELLEARGIRVTTWAGWLSSTRTSAGSAGHGNRRMPRTPTSCANE